METSLSINLFLRLVLLGAFFSQQYYAMQIFSPELCCGDTPLKVDDNLRCCGNVSYTPDSMCCFEPMRGHYVLSLPPAVAPSAAPATTSRRASRGSGSFSRRNSNNAVGSLFASSSISGGGSANARFLSCCGDEVFDFRFYTCCDGVIHKQSINGNTACCKKKTFDPYAMLCCKDSILPKETFSSFCCGARAYDQATQVCCGETVYDVDAGNGSGGSVSESYSCCGDKPLTSNQLCCQGNRMEKATTSSYCCGSTQFDFETELCCENQRVFPKSTPNEFCCGPSKTYDSTTHLCCLDNVIPKKKIPTVAPTVVAGRSGGSKSVETLFSKRLNLFPIDDDEEVFCCSNVTYDWKNELCCDGRVVSRGDTRDAGAGRSIKCCGQQKFNEDNQICCNQKVFEKRTRAEDCCSSAVFNVQNQVCCEGVIHDLTPNSLIYCCGKSTFDPEKEACCSGRKTAKSIAN